MKTTSPNRGPGLLYIIAALVVVALVGARFFGFSPSPPRPDGSPPTRADRPIERVVPDPARMTQVLVYHTHATENYAPKEPFSTKGPGDVVAVGEAFVEALKDEGIGSVHVQTVHDLPEWNQAYSKTRASVEATLARHNGIRAIVDIHRDGVEEPTEGFATAVVNGETVAKILFVVGSTDNPLAQENIRYARRLQEHLEALAPGITRGVRVMARSTNQELHPNTIIAYVGDHQDNTLEEAVRSAQWLAKAVATLMGEDG